VKRWYGGDGIGFEPTVNEYIRNLVGVFHEARRVLKNTGVLWTVIGDSFSRHGGSRASHPNGIVYQDAGRPPGNLLMIPARLAMALQDGGWILRHDVVWDKGSVRPESATDRVTRTHEFAYMFAKNRRYFYDQDPLRIPVVTPYSTRGRDKPGLIRRDENRRDLQVNSNPLGRNVGSVWQTQRGNYRGRHPATFPTELARRMIVSSCDEKSVVLDVFGGSGTTALVALQLGHRAITIDINPDYTNEARERLSAAPADFPIDTDGQNEGSTSGRTFSIAANIQEKPDSDNVVDLMDAKRRQKASPKKASPHLPVPAQSKRACAARAIGTGAHRIGRIPCAGVADGVSLPRQS
jgi:DNA modification methylase